MAVKKKAAPTPSGDMADIFNELMGKNDENLGVRGYLDTGIPELNFALSGSYRRGMPKGRMVEIFGPASCGKTFLATMVMISGQKDGGISTFADHERSFEPVLAENLGLDLDPNVFRYIKPDTFEASVRTAVNVCKRSRDVGFHIDRPLVWVFDSVASMIPHEKMYDDKGKLRPPGDYNMRDKLALASATSQNYPTLAQFAEDNNMLVLLLNQIRLKPGVMYGDPTTTPGGNAAEFYCSIRISIGKKDITNGKKGPDRVVTGFEVTAKIIKNKVARPFRTATWRVMYDETGSGVYIDQIATNLDFMVRAGLIEKEGAYCSWEGKRLYQSEVEERLRADPDGLAKLMALLPADEKSEEKMAEMLAKATA